jgi:hypothetical protein
MRQGARIWLFLGALGVAATLAFLLLLLFANALQVTSGTVMLGVFSLSMLYIAWVLHSGRHTDPTEAPGAVAQVGPEHVFPSSWAPVLLSLGIAMFVCGVRFTPVLLAVGGMLIVFTLFAWIVQRVDVARLTHGHPAVPADHADAPAADVAASTPEAGAGHNTGAQLGDANA